MSAQGLSQKEYLKKYLSGDDKKKKRKPRSACVVANRLRVVDDDIGLQDIRPLKTEELDLYDLQEDGPQIAGIIDERPEEIKIKEAFLTKKWKVVADDSDCGVKIIDKNRVEVECIQNVECEVTWVRKNQKKNNDRSLIQLSENDSSLALRESEINNRITHPGFDLDISPPRKVKKFTVKQYENGNSSFKDRKGKVSSNPEVSYWRKRNEMDLDLSSSKKSKKHHHESIFKSEKQYSYLDASPQKKCTFKGVKQVSDSNTSSPRKSKKFVLDEGYADELLPSRNKRKDSDESLTRHRRDSNLHISPPRRQKELPLRTNRRKFDSVDSPSRDNRLTASENSLQRKYKLEDFHYKHSKIRRDTDALPSKKEKRSESPQKRNRGSKHGQRTSHWEDARDSLHKKKEAEGWRSFSPQLELYNFSTKTQDKSFHKECASGSFTAYAKQHGDIFSLKSKDHSRKMDGKKPDLVGTFDLKIEIDGVRHSEKKLFENMDLSVSGRGATTVVREKSTGKRRGLNQETKEKIDKDDNKADRDAKYMQWGKGLKQVTDQNQKLQEDLYEMSKPLARYADDTDLDKYLRDQEREGDPMLNYIHSKSKAENINCKPQYEGSFLPNRFSIRPGSRWDGVDRSNGYERQWFEQWNAKKALEEEAYKWSTADM